MPAAVKKLAYSVVRHMGKAQGEWSHHSHHRGQQTVPQFMESCKSYEGSEYILEVGE